MADLQKSGYLEVKEPSNIKGRKLKTWRHKWVVLQEMSNLASGTLAAKLELYPTEASAINKSSDKITYLLENVTAIEPCQSKTHKLAFQIVTNVPTLVLCADCEYTTNVWITRLKKIFSPNQDSFSVEILQNLDSKKFSLTGLYRMGVSPEAVTIYNSKNNETMGWRLETLKRFHMDKNKNDTLVIESGAKAECGEAKFEFRTRQVADILTAIKNNIQIAINERRQAQSQNTSVDSRSRTISTSSFEQGFQSILLDSEKPRTSSLGNASNASTESNDTSTSKGNSENTFKIIGETQKPRSASLSYRKPDDSQITPYATSSKSQTNTKPRLSGHFRSSSLDSSPFQSSEALNLNRSVESKRPNSCDVQDRRRFSSEYDTLHDERNRWLPEIDIVSKMKLRSPENKEIELSVDSHGYSHVTSLKSHEIQETADFHLKSNNSGPSVRDSKERMRTVSGNSVESKRSSSVGSHDSGVSSLNTGRIIKEEEVSTCREGSSFDSAISSDISVTVSEAIVVSSSESDFNSRLSRSCSHPSSSSLDSKSHLDEVEVNNADNSQTHSKHNRSKSDPVGYDIVEKESEYEELDKYRKDIKQFLGIDKNVKPEQVPPSLPERPSTMPAKRKQVNKRKKKVSFPLISRTIKSNRSDSLSSSSSSDSEENTTVKPIVSVSAWPLEKKRVQNSLYESTEPAEDQRQNPEIASSWSGQQSSSSESSVSISSMSRWPLAMTATANCNRFYSSSNEILKDTKENTVEEDSESKSKLESTENVTDKIEDDDHIYASVESKPLVDENSTKLEDLLTGDETYVPSFVLPVIQPVPATPVSNVDLLTGDLLNFETSVSTTVPASNVTFPIILDQLVPIPDEPQLFASNVKDDLFNDDEREGHVRMRRKGEVINPFPNLARYSGPIEDLLQEDNTDKSSELELVKDSSYVNINSDPFDIFHIGVISSNLVMNKSASDSAVENTYSNQTVVDQGQGPTSLSRSASDQWNVTPEENPYIAMQTKDKEDEYVSPSVLK